MGVTLIWILENRRRFVVRIVTSNWRDWVCDTVYFEINRFESDSCIHEAENALRWPFEEHAQVILVDSFSPQGHHAKREWTFIGGFTEHERFHLFARLCNKFQDLCLHSCGILTRSLKVLVPVSHIFFNHVSKRLQLELNCLQIVFLGSWKESDRIVCTFRIFCNLLPNVFQPIANMSKFALNLVF